MQEYFWPDYYKIPLYKWFCSITRTLDDNFMLYLPEAALITMLTYLITSIAMELDKKHAKKNLALETLYAMQYGLFFILVIFCLNTYFGLVLITESGYLAANLFITTLKTLLITTVMFILNNSVGYIKNHKKDLLEYPLIVGLSLVFMLVLIGTHHLVSAFLCIVGFSLNLYVLILFDAPEAVAREAGIKYYYLSTFSSGLILYGTFLIFMTLKTLNFKIIDQILFSLPHTHNMNLINTGALLILLGLFFKLSAFPGHL